MLLSLLWEMGCSWMLALLPDSHHSLLIYYLFLFLPSFLVCVVGFLAWSRRTSSFPPGPLALPVLGHLHLLGDLPHQSLHKLSKIHGPLMGLRLGSVPVIVASTPDMAALILQTHDLVFSSRPSTAAAIYNMLDRSDIVFSPYGPHWRLMRQICVTHLLSSRRLDSFRHIREEEVALLMRSVFDDGKMGREVPVLSKLLSVSNNIISRMTLGKRFAELGTNFHHPFKSIVDLFNEMFYLDGVFNVGDYIACLQWMDLQGYVRRMKIVGKNFRAIFQQIIDARRELRRDELTSPKDSDLLDVLLSVSVGGQPDVQLTDEKIKAVLLDMFAGGTDTMAVATQWALAELLINPEIMKKAQKELDFVVGNERFVQESDLAQLPYLQAVVKESMRLHPVAPLLIPHESTQPCKVAGYNIPAKTRAFVNVWAIGRDETAWERPEEFWPERFMESSVDVRGQHFQLLPFGSGRRVCPAVTLGLLSVQMMLASLLHGFELSLPSLSDSSERPSVDMCEKFGVIVAMAKPLVVMAAPRLPHHLYSGS